MDVLSDITSDNIKKARTLIIQCSGHEDAKNELKKWIGVETDEDCYNYLKDAAEALGKTALPPEMALQLVEYKTSLEIEYRNELKCLGKISRAITENVFNICIGRPWKELWADQMLISQDFDNFEQYSIVKQFEFELQKELFEYSSLVKSGNLTKKKGWRKFKESRNVMYRLKKLNLFKKKKNDYQEAYIILTEGLYLGEQEPINTKSFFFSSHTIIQIEYNDKTVLAVYSNGKGIVYKEVVDNCTGTDSEKDDEGMRRHRAFADKWKKK